jgi:hypothetical protein
LKDLYGLRAPKDIVIDTIPLLLFLVGTYDANLINGFKRLNQYEYTIKDFKILQYFLTSSKSIVVTPGVLSEISNFAEKLENDGFSKMLKKNSSMLRRIKEIYIKKEDILDSNHVFKFGFTDTSLILAAKIHNGEILSRDYKLFNYCQSLGIKAWILEKIIENMEDLFDRKFNDSK